MSIDGINTLPPYQVKIERNKALTEKRNYFIFQHKLASGEVRFVEVHSSPIDFQDNTILFSIIHDITERRNAENKLSDSEEKYRLLLEKSGIGVGVFSLDGKIQLFNQKAIQNLGGKAEDYIGKSFIEVFGEQLGSIYNERILKTARSKKSLEFEDSLVSPTGNYWFLSNHTRITDGDGNVIGVQVLSHDITERKQTEEALRESEEKYRSLIQYSSDPIFSFNPDETYRFVNEAFAKTFGKKPEEIIGKSPHSIFPHDEAEKRLALVRKVLRTGRKDEIEVKVPNQSGEYRYYVTMVDPIRNHQGEVVFITCVSKDITERKQVEEDLRVSELRHRTILQTAMDGFWLVNLEGKLLEVNETYCRMSGYSEKELIRMHVSDFEAKESLDDTVSHIQEIIKKGEDRFESIHRRKDGSIFNVEISVKYQSTDGGRLVSFLNDITDRKQAEQELINAKEKAEESDRLKSAFLENMSHEIRTPMNGILGFAELLKEPDLTGEQQKYFISIIERSGARMLTIINDIIDISKIESGQMKLSVSEADINDQIESVFEFFKPDVAKKSMQIFVKNGLQGNDSVIMTDHEKVYAILSNLVKNAIKFSISGSIHVGYEKKGKYLEFFIADNGIGIQPELNEIIFERFRQGSEMLNRNYEGAGLGLTISKAYVEMLGGKIWVDSESGKGSVFYFTIPYIVSREEIVITKYSTMDKSEEKPSKNLKILIAEDDEGSEMLLSMAVKKFGDKIIKVKTGIQAIEACRNNPDIDLILMDIKMPEMDGYEATRQIRQFNKNVVIIAQTAFGLIDDREKALGVGCNDYISKPLNITHLKELILKYFNK